MAGKSVAVLFGGRSPEHEVSCVSALNIMHAINKDEWEILPVGITKEGHWLYVKDLDAIRDGSWKQSGIPAFLSPDSSSHVLYVKKEGCFETLPVDLVWPALHGEYGEDGTVQGLLEMAGIPYVGTGVLCSAVSMDKLYTKIVVDRLDIRQARYESYISYGTEDKEAVIERVEKRFGYPVFVKPARAGSSCGVSRADNREELVEAIRKALEIDRKVLIEEMIRGREIEMAVLQKADGTLGVTCPGEILAAAAFYDYDAKYNNPESKTVIDPDLPENVKDELKKDALAIFRALDGQGLSRVDFFVTDEGGVVFNEINTMPGFTNISMYPKLWEAEGFTQEELAAELMESGLRRYD